MENTEIRVSSVAKPISPGGFSFNLGNQLKKSIEDGTCPLLPSEQGVLNTTPIVNIVKDREMGFYEKDGKIGFTSDLMMSTLAFKLHQVKNGFSTGEYISSEKAKESGVKIKAKNHPVQIPLYEYDKEKDSKTTTKVEYFYNVEQFEEPDKIRAFADAEYKKNKEALKKSMEEKGYESAANVKLEKNPNKHNMKVINFEFDNPKKHNATVPDKTLVADYLAQWNAAIFQKVYMKVSPEDSKMIKDALLTELDSKTKEGKANVFNMSNLCTLATKKNPMANLDNVSVYSLKMAKAIESVKENKKEVSPTVEQSVSREM